MTGKLRSHNPVPVSDLVSGILDPVLAKRAGITTSLVQAWDEIVGDRLSLQSRPDQIKWNRRVSDDDPFEPATLIIACEAGAALYIQHETTEIMARVNAFLGYSAVDRIKIVQRPVSVTPPMPKKARHLPEDERNRIAEKVSHIDDEELRDALERLGHNVAASRD